MEREQAIEICRHWQRPRAWYNLIEIHKRQRDIVFDIAGNSVERTVAKLEQCSKWLKRHTDSLGALTDWVRLNRPDLIGELPVFDWTATEREHVRDYCKAMQRVETGILCIPPSAKTANDINGRKPDANRTQGKNSGKNFRPWDANCERMAKEYIRQCVKDGSEIDRLPFITDELRKNASRYPKAKAPVTIDRAFRENEANWKPALSKALSERTQAGRKK